MTTTKNMLDLSTEHTPGNEPDFGTLRVQRHEYGWTVFISSFTLGDEPAWIADILKAARAMDCVLVNFDRDGDVDEAFKVYDY